jgi:hypothetical protein
MEVGADVEDTGGGQAWWLAVWHVQAVEGSPTIEVEDNTLSRLPEHEVRRPG